MLEDFKVLFIIYFKDEDKLIDNLLVNFLCKIIDRSIVHYLINNDSMEKNFVKDKVLFDLELDEV